MTEQQILEEMKPFIDACDKMIASKFIMIDKRISDVLKNIATTPCVFEVVKECMINFNFEQEWRMATAKAGQILPPEDPHKFIAFAFSILNCIDDKKISASAFLTAYYSKVDEQAGPYSVFCSVFVERLKNCIIAKLLNKAEYVVKKKEDVVVSINKDVMARLAFLVKDLKDYVQGLKKLKKSKITKGELIEILNALSLAIKNNHAAYIKALVLSVKAGYGKEKEIERRLFEILEIVSKTFLEA